VSLEEARKALPAEPLAWAWLNLETVRQAPQAKEIFARPSNQPILTVPFNGYLDVLGRSPYLAAGFYRRSDGFLTTLRLPRGREGMPAEVATHVPPPGEPGSRPLLEPKGVLYSTSYYLDVAKFWELRDKLFNEQLTKSFEEFDKNSGRFLAGLQFSKLLSQVGPYQRIVVAHQPRPGYKVVPKQSIPAFAVVVEQRDPDFGKAVEAAVRGAALLAGTQFKVKLVEEKHGDVTLVGYRFPEDVKQPQDVNDLRFNFSPCLFAVGNQFVLCSTLELGHELIDLLKKETEGDGHLATVRTQLYAAGGAELLKAFEKQILTQTILDQAIPAEAAARQVNAFIELVRQLGVLRYDVAFGAKEFRFDLQLRTDK
jgi:hypothetical protein